MIRFLPISLCLLLFLACAAPQYSTSTRQKSPASITVNSYFVDTSTVVTYRAVLDLAQQQITGTLVIRTYNDEQRRVALLSDMGQTLFDISVFKEEHVVNTILPAMDKKFLTSELANIFRVLTQPYNTHFVMQSSVDTAQVYEVKLKKRSNYYHYQNDILKRIHQVGKRKPRLNIDFFSTSPLPQQITLLHSRFPLRISLSLQNDNL